MFICNELLKFRTTRLKSLYLIFFPSNPNLTLNDLSISSTDGERTQKDLEGLVISYYFYVILMPAVL